MISSGEFFPSHVGMPIEPDTKGAKYYLLEVHYDNPTLKQGKKMLRIIKNVFDNVHSFFAKFYLRTISRVFNI